MGTFCVSAFANNADEPQLTLDFNKRYTDISEYDDVNDPYLDFGAEKREKEERRNIYAIILVVLLIISIIVFIVVLKRQPSVEELSGSLKQKPKIQKKEPSLKDEEKSDDGNDDYNQVSKEE